MPLPNMKKVVSVADAFEGVPAIVSPSCVIGFSPAGTRAYCPGTARLDPPASSAFPDLAPSNDASCPHGATGVYARDRQARP